MAQRGIAVEINLTSNDVILGIQGDQHPFSSYRRHGVPLTLSTDDEGVSRIDLTHEYQRAVETYDLSYRDIKAISRNALTYSFLPGSSIFSEPGKFVEPCRRMRADKPNPSDECQDFLANSEKAWLQWELEKRFAEFESGLTKP